MKKQGKKVCTNNCLPKLSINVSLFSLLLLMEKAKWKNNNTSGLLSTASAGRKAVKIGSSPHLALSSTMPGSARHVSPSVSRTFSSSFLSTSGDR